MYGGTYGSCTRLRGFADRCVTAPPTRHYRHSIAEIYPGFMTCFNYKRNNIKFYLCKNSCIIVIGGYISRTFYRGEIYADNQEKVSYN